VVLLGAHVLRFVDVADVIAVAILQQAKWKLVCALMQTWNAMCWSSGVGG